MKKIKIYTTNWCSYCDLAKRFFDEKGWDYEEINIEEIRFPPFLKIDDKKLTLNILFDPM